MNLIRPCFIMTVCMLLYACASVQPEYSLPPQKLNVPADNEKTRVVFYNGNGFNLLFLDGSWRIGIKVDGVGVENLHIEKYVQVFLAPGSYTLELSHIDFFITFKDTYDFEVGSDTMFVKVYNTLVGNDYEVQDAEPKDFRNNYKPANE